ncbi:hypothetical protein V866_006540 [Kwoniella sp. B9012]
MYSTTIIRALFPLFVTSSWFVVTQAQWTDGNPYDPEKLTCATGQWFDNVVADRSPSEPGMLITSFTDVGDCQRGCFESDYLYSYWQNSTQKCFCHQNREVYPSQVGNTTMITDGCWTGSLARLDYLRSDFNSAFCTDLTTISTSQPYIHEYTGTIKGCIDRCGYPNSTSTARAISVTPIFATDPDWQTYVYDCECYDTSWIGTVENAVPCGFGVRHMFTRWYSSGGQA